MTRREEEIAAKAENGVEEPSSPDGAGAPDVGPVTKSEADTSSPDGAGVPDQESITLDEVSGQMDEETADIVVQAIDELAVRSTEIEQLKEELEQVTDQWKRQAAEFQNYRRRTEEEKQQMVSFGKGLVVQQLLDVVDDFQRSLQATEQTEKDGGTEGVSAYLSLKNGVELVYQKLMDELKKMDVEPIDAVGQPFDEDYHEALMQQPAADGQEPGIILTEIQRGYRMGDRVLRHSKVVVTS